jgi:hypothetical protein
MPSTPDGAGSIAASASERGADRGRKASNAIDA